VSLTLTETDTNGHDEVVTNAPGLADHW